MRNKKPSNKLLEGFLCIEKRVNYANLVFKFLSKASKNSSVYK